MSATRPDQAFTIRPARPGDEDAITAVVDAAFATPHEAVLVANIRSSPEYVPSLELVAEADGAIVGHVMVSGAGLVDGETTRSILTLSPLAVAPQRQRQGIGGALVRTVTARADDRGAPLVVLEGAPAYYGRLGFEPAAAHGILMSLPDWAPPEAAQVMRLRAYGPEWRGRVVYPLAFDSVIEH